jgi:hypothetical protein
MNQNLPEMPAHQDEELTLRDVALRFRDFLLEVRANWKLMLLLCAAGTAAMLISTLLTPRVYPAVLTFMVREDSQGGAGGIASILGQFGLGGNAAGEFNLDKISELGKSQRIVRAALFDSAQVNGKRDLIANHILDIYRLGEKEWRRSPALRQLRFQRADPDSISPLENLALKLLHEHIVQSKKKLVNIGFAKQTGILSLTVTSLDQDLSIHLCRSLYRHLNEFYVEQSTAQPRLTVKNLQQRADSIRAVLTGTERLLARTEDRNLGLLLREDRVPQKRMGSDVQMLTVMYAEVVKNLETASFLLKNTTPVFLEIDQPTLPIIGVRTPLTRSAAYGFVVGLLLGIVIIFVRKLLRGDG